MLKKCYIDDKVRRLTGSPYLIQQQTNAFYHFNSQQMQKRETRQAVNMYQKLKEKRRQMKRNCIPTDNIEYSATCKTIRRKMKEDIRKQEEKHIIEAIEKSKAWNEQDKSNAWRKANSFLLWKKMGRTFMIKIDLWRDVSSSTKNWIYQEELQLTNTHIVIQLRHLPLTHHPYDNQKLRHQ